jgi:hypothetical protein
VSEGNERGPDGQFLNRRREDPLLQELKRAVKAWPIVVTVSTLVTGIYSTGMGVAFWRANQVTRQQFEREQEERRTEQQEASHRLSKIEGQLEVLIMQGAAHGKR